MGNSNGKHLEGWQWRESKRIMTKKERTKAKQKMGEKRARENEQNISEFIISREKENFRYGIVAETTRGQIRVLLDDQYFDCRLAQGLPYELINSLAVGDHVTIINEGDEYFVDHMLKRKSVIARLRRDSSRWGGTEEGEHVIAANVDTAVIVVSAKNPPLHPKLIDRYLVMTQYGHINPIICLNKSDLGFGDKNILEPYRKLGIKVIMTSTETGEGIEDLKESIKNQTAVLVGHSGVGKSSLINAIFPEAEIKVSQVDKKAGKGRHTTTSSTLRRWADQSFIIDTPGIRSLETLDITKIDLQTYFPEIFSFAAKCKFKDCLHDKETICAVKEAVNIGEISKDRYESYLRILSEL